jgi:glycosyltransferase involved in cell wall biosynthesis
VRMGAGEERDAFSPHPLRIVHVLAPARVGGLERVVQALATGHSRCGHEVHVVPVFSEDEPRHPFLEPLRDAGVSVHPLAVPGRAYRRERAQFAELCRRILPDVVHSHGYRTDVVDAPVARRLGIPIVTTVHGFTRGGWKNRLYETLQKRAFRRFDAVAAVSRMQVEEIRAAGSQSSHVHLLRNAWAAGDAPLPAAEARALLGVPDGALHVGWVGRLSPEKGPDLLLEALARLSDLPFVCSVIGEGRQAAALRQRAHTLGLADRLLWHGYRSDAARLYSAFDVFVLSSRTEGTPIALFEAMAAGAPVVATAVGGVPDVVGPDEAVLVQPGCPDRLAHAIREVAADAAVTSLRVRSARERLDRQFSAVHWLERYELLYRSLLTSKARTTE